MAFERDRHEERSAYPWWYLEPSHIGFHLLSIATYPRFE